MYKSLNLCFDLVKILKPESFIEHLKILRPLICPFGRILYCIKDTENKNFLDIGCGDCSFLFLVKKYKNFGKLSGIDIKITQKTIDTCNKNNIKIYKSDSFSVLGDNKYDVVSIIDVLHHVERHKRLEFINNALDLVRPGGQLIIKDMNNRPFFHAFMNRIHDLIFARQFINYISSNELENYIKSNGFSVLNAGKIIMFVYSHYWIFSKKEY